MEIERIAGPLRELLCEREIIARCELLMRTYDLVQAAKLSDQEAEELHKVVGENIAAGIFASIMSKEPIFFGLPKLDTYTQMDGRIFHFLHTKKYSKQDFANANSKFLRSLPDLRKIMKRSLENLLKNFMKEAGYNQSLDTQQELIFSAKESNLRAFVFTSINAVSLDKCIPESGINCVILVPSGENLEPFMKFYRENGTAAEDDGINIWIANMEKGTIDPFIGYTTDLDIYNQFENPRLAEMVRSNWSKKQ